MARTAEDCAAILRIIAGHDPLDASSTERALDLDPSKLDARSKAPLRLGVLPHDYAKHDAEPA
jgi:Asp-tRNA(Asn)/Glu-tRNA(Gln) amidotransferase A subunit family amidase